MDFTPGRFFSGKNIFYFRKKLLRRINFHVPELSVKRLQKFQNFLLKLIGTWFSCDCFPLNTTIKLITKLQRLPCLLLLTALSDCPDLLDHSSILLIVACFRFPTVFRFFLLQVRYVARSSESKCFLTIYCIILSTKSLLSRSNQKQCINEYWSMILKHRFLLQSVRKVRHWFHLSKEAEFKDYI